MFLSGPIAAGAPGPGWHWMGVPLSPGMASRKLQVYDFAWRYTERWGKSPSYGEIAGAFEISRQRAKAIVRSLVMDGWIVRRAGARRAMSFPRRSADVGELLKGAYPAAPFTNTTLPLIAELDHIPDVEICDEGHHDKTSAGDRQARADRSDRAD